MTGYLLLAANGLVLAVAAVVIWLRGRRLLSALFAIAVAMHFIGLTYILTSDELPGFSTSFSLTYRVFDFLTNFGYLAHSVAVLAICLALAPVQPGKRIENPASGQALGS